MEAIRICLERLRGSGRGPFNEYDYHLSAEGSAPADSDPIQIELSFVETDSEPWTDEVVQALEGLVAFDDEDHRRVTLRVTSSFDRNGVGPATDWEFLDANGNPFAKADEGSNPAHDFSAHGASVLSFRAAGRCKAFRFQWSLLAHLSSPSSAFPRMKRRNWKRSLPSLNRRLIEAHQPLLEVRQRLEDATKVIEFGASNVVAIDALPTKLFALLSRTQVSLASRSGARVPVEFQGEGTQSLTVLLLFGAFLRSQLSDCSIPRPSRLRLSKNRRLICIRPPSAL